MRWMSLLITFWSTAAMPSLCMGGWLEHPCAPCEPGSSSASVCSCSATPCCDDNYATPAYREVHTAKCGTDACTRTEPSECGHEAGCLADPCTPVVRAEPEGPDLSADHHEATFDTPVLDTAIRLQSHFIRSHPAEKVDRMTRQYADRALPLLL